jgi:hypothetical protein
MSIRKEFREFFTRHIAVNSGTKKDQEVGFPTTTTKQDCCGNIVNVYNRLLKDDLATDDVIKKFLESIGFKLNIEDTAQLTQQGFVLRASDSDAAQFAYVNPASNYSKAVLPHQLANVIAGAGATVTLEYYDVTLDDGTTYANLGLAQASGNNFRPIYEIALSGAASGAVTLLYNNISNVANGAAASSTLDNFDINLSTYFNAVGDLIEFKSQVTAIVGGGGKKTIEVNMDVNTMLEFDTYENIVDIHGDITYMGSNVYKFRVYYDFLDSTPNEHHGGIIDDFTAVLPNPCNFSIGCASPTSTAGDVTSNSLRIIHTKK